MKIEHKTFDAEIKAADDSTLTIEHWISTDEKDRGGDRMVPEGMIIKGRPVVLLAHGRGATMGTEPVAKPLDIRVESFRGKKGVVAKTQFYPDAVGQRLYEKVRDGYMPSFSIGYGVIKSEDVYKDGKFDARLVSKWELYEYSLVSVPMNAGATTFKDGEALSFKLLPDDDAEGCCGDCKGDVKCAGHREKADPPKPGECPTCKALVTVFTKDGAELGIACEKCQPEEFARLMKEANPPPPDEETTDPCATCGKKLWKEWTKDLPYKTLRVYCKTGCEIVVKAPMPGDDMSKRMDAVEKMMADMEKKMADCDEMCKKCEAAMQAMADAMKGLEPLLKTLPPEPDGGDKGKGSDGNPPDGETPPLLVFRDVAKEEADRKKAEIDKVTAAVTAAIAPIMKAQVDKLMGRVP